MRIVILFFFFLNSLAFAYAPPKWNKKEREDFLTQCKDVGNSHKYCVCFSTMLEEAYPPSAMLEILEGESDLQKEADGECAFNNI